MNSDYDSIGDILAEVRKNNSAKFWMVVGDGNSPMVRHTSKEHAMTEAKCLASANPGLEFFVLESTALVKVASVSVTHL